MNMAQFVALGELLIDFIQHGDSENQNPLYEANPGGAPGNFLAMTKKLGNSASFVGKVGNDAFGKQLEDTLLGAGLITDGLIKSDKYHTTLAFVHHDSHGDRSFSFYREADAYINEDDIKEDLFDNKDVFHFGTLSMTNEVCKAATMKAIKIAQSKKLLISFDPNLRKNLWDDLSKAKEAFIEGFKVCNVLKIADNELQWFTGIEDLEEAIKAFRKNYPSIGLIFLTLGKDGSKAFYNDIEVTVPTFLEVPCVDTTGAGDSFMGSAMSCIMDIGFNNLDKESLKESLLFANAAASIVASRKGVIKSLPTVEEIEKLKATAK
jgi:fructokinase